VGAIGKLAGLHAFEQVHVFGNAAVAERRILAWLGQRAAIGPHFIGILAIDIGVAGGNQVFGKGSHPVEIVGRLIKIGFACVFP